MNLDARLKKVEEQAQERVMAEFCVCVLNRQLSASFREYLAARGVAYAPENPYIVTRPCGICLGDTSYDLTPLDDEERDAWHRLADWADERRMAGLRPEIPEEIARLIKWLRQRCRAADERVFGKHCYAAVMFAYHRANERFPFASDLIDEEMRKHDEACAMEDVSKCYQMEVK
ncbi:MAG TPA: hypothetical protein VKN18_25935 [Blastocatellia bacterium]|nr:hypothetical protein [Blastocatellia bacterium]